MGYIPHRHHPVVVAFGIILCILWNPECLTPPTMAFQDTPVIRLGSFVLSSRKVWGSSTTRNSKPGGTSIVLAVQPSSGIYKNDDDDNNGIKRENADSNTSAMNVESNPPWRKSQRARMGGRRRRLSKTSRSTSVSKTQPTLDIKRFVRLDDSMVKNKMLLRISSLLFGVLLFLRLASTTSPTGVPSSPSIVYYQSTVVESRVYRSDGEWERRRQENIQSNIPGLVEKKITTTRTPSTPAGSGTPLLENDDYDDRIDDDIRSMLELQQRLWDDIFLFR